MLVAMSGHSLPPLDHSADPNERLLARAASNFGAVRFRSPPAAFCRREPLSLSLISSRLTNIVVAGHVQQRRGRRVLGRHRGLRAERGVPAQHARESDPAPAQPAAAGKPGGLARGRAGAGLEPARQRRLGRRPRRSGARAAAKSAWCARQSSAATGTPATSPPLLTRVLLPLAAAALAHLEASANRGASRSRADQQRAASATPAATDDCRTATAAVGASRSEDAAARAEFERVCAELAAANADLTRLAAELAAAEQPAAPAPVPKPRPRPPTTSAGTITDPPDPAPEAVLEPEPPPPPPPLVGIAAVVVSAGSNTELTGEVLSVEEHSFVTKGLRAELEVARADCERVAAEGAKAVAVVQVSPPTRRKLCVG